MSNRFRAGHLFTSAALVIGFALVPSPLRIQAGAVERFAGWATDGKITAKFSAGVAQWDAKGRRVSIGFAPAPLAKSDRDTFLKYAWWSDSMQRVMSLQLDFNPGENGASLRGLHGYSVSFFHFPGNPHDNPMYLSYSAGGSGVVTDFSDHFRERGWKQLAGDLQPGGRIRGHVAFADVYEIKKEHIGPIPYRWDLEFDAVLQ